ncbi:hypothetical protein JCM5350_001330 [Sporobolomyces pararoseus]
MSGSIRSGRHPNRTGNDGDRAEQSSDSQTAVSSTEQRRPEQPSSRFTALRRGSNDEADVLKTRQRIRNGFRTVNPLAKRLPKEPKFRLVVPDPSFIDGRIASEPVQGDGSPPQIEAAARLRRPAIREEEYDRWIQKYVDLVLSKTREFAHAQMEEHWIHVRKTQNRPRVLQDYEDENREQAALVEQYYCAAFSRLVQEHLEAMDIKRIEERAEIGATRLSHLKRTFDEFNPLHQSQAPGPLERIRVSLSFPYPSHLGCLNSGKLSTDLSEYFWSVRAVACQLLRGQSILNADVHGRSKACSA